MQVSTDGISEALLSSAAFELDQRQTFETASKNRLQRTKTSPLALGQRDELSNPVAVAVDDARQRLYTVDSKAHKVKICSPESGQPLDEFGERGTGPGQFDFPANIALDREGRVYVTDAMNFCVQVFATEGCFLEEFGRQGTRFGQFLKPKGIALDAFQNIYVVDSDFDNFQIFDQQRRLLMFVGDGGQIPGRFWLPAGIHVDRHNRIYAADQNKRRIQIFQLLDATTEEPGPRPRLADASNPAVQGGESSEDEKTEMGSVQSPGPQKEKKTPCGNEGRMMIGNRNSPARIGGLTLVGLAMCWVGCGVLLAEAPPVDPQRVVVRVKSVPITEADVWEETQKLDSFHSFNASQNAVNTPRIAARASGDSIGEFPFSDLSLDSNSQTLASGLNYRPVENLSLNASLNYSHNGLPEISLDRLSEQARRALATDVLNAELGASYLRRLGKLNWHSGGGVHRQRFSLLAGAPEAKRRGSNSRSTASSSACASRSTSCRGRLRIFRPRCSETWTAENFVSLLSQCSP